MGVEKDNPEFLLAKVLARIVTDQDSIVELLDKAVTAQQSKSSTSKYGVSYLIALDPQLLVDIAAAYPKTVSIIVVFLIIIFFEALMH